MDIGQIQSNFQNLYVHIPFCRSICHYCNFYKVPSRDADYAQFFQALSTELSLWQSKLAPKLKTIYFGGGTPSETPPGFLEKFLSELAPYIDSETEITMEANPKSIGFEGLSSLKQAGVNRLSVGTQSLQDKELKLLGRAHFKADVLKSLEVCCELFKNVSADLIYGLPNQSAKEVSINTEILLRFPIKHISAYTLTLKPDHHLYSTLPDDDTTLTHTRAVLDVIEPRGWCQYESSNFCKPGFESQHNSNYWTSKSYLSLGPSAHAFDGKAKRWKNISNWKQYCENLAKGELPIDWSEELTIEQQKTEYLLTHLRIADGLNFQKYTDKFGEDLYSQKRSIFNAFESAGLGKIIDGNWLPSFSGLMMADETAIKLLG